MKARIRREEFEFPPGVGVRLAGRTETSWRGRFLGATEDRHPHEDRLDAKSSEELLRESENILETIENNEYERGRENFVEFLVFELWLVRRVGKRKGMKS